MERTGEWESRWWSPVINAEHLAMRESCALFDLSAFAVLDITGPGALDAVQSIAVAQLDVPPGRVVYTSLLDEAAGSVADLTVMRLGAAPVPGGHRRRDRDDGQEVDRRPAARRRPGAAWPT